MGFDWEKEFNRNVAFDSWLSEQIEHSQEQRSTVIPLLEIGTIEEKEARLRREKRIFLATWENHIKNLQTAQQMVCAENERIAALIVKSQAALDLCYEFTNSRLGLAKFIIESIKYRREIMRNRKGKKHDRTV